MKNQIIIFKYFMVNKHQIKENNLYNNFYKKDQNILKIKYNNNNMNN